MKGGVTPDISVVMVTYNQSAFVEAAIQSIFSQTYLDSFEFVIFDDASSDDTPTRIALLISSCPAHISIKVRFAKIRRGAFRNFSSALRVARGRVIVVADGDDFSFPDRLEKSMNLLCSDKISACGAIVAGRQSKGILGRYRDLGDVAYHIAHCLPDRLQSWTPAILGASFVFKRELLDRFGPIDSVLTSNHNADQAIFWRAVSSGGFKAVVTPHIRYTSHLAGITIRRREMLARVEENWLLVFDYHWKRTCNRIGNALLAADVFFQQGFIEHVKERREYARALARELFEVHLELRDIRVWEVIPEFFCQKKFEKWTGIGGALLSSLDILANRSDVKSRDIVITKQVFFWSQIAESGPFWIYRPNVFLDLPAAGVPMSSIALLRCLARLRQFVIKNETGIANVSAAGLDVIRRVLIPRVDLGSIRYRGSVRPNTLASLCALPIPDFCLLLLSINGSVSLENDLRQRLERKQITKKQAILDVFGLWGLVIHPNYSFKEKAKVFIYSFL